MLVLMGLMAVVLLSLFSRRRLVDQRSMMAQRAPTTTAGHYVRCRSSIVGMTPLADTGVRPDPVAFHDAPPGNTSAFAPQPQSFAIPPLWNRRRNWADTRRAVLRELPDANHTFGVALYHRKRRRLQRVLIGVHQQLCRVHTDTSRLWLTPRRKTVETHAWTLKSNGQKPGTWATTSSPLRARPTITRWLAASYLNQKDGWRFHPFSTSLVLMRSLSAPLGWKHQQQC